MGCLGAHVETEDATGVKSPPARDERKLPKFIPEELQEEFFENRRSVWAGAFLDGVNVGALGLMAGVTWQLGRAAIVDWISMMLAAVSAFVLFRFRINSAWILLAGGTIGLVYKLVM